MNIIARIPVIAADHPRLTVRVPMSEPCVVIPATPSPEELVLEESLSEEASFEQASEPPAEAAEPQPDAARLDAPGIADRTPDKPRPKNTKPRSRRDEHQTKTRSEAKSGAKSKPKSRPKTWALTPPKSSQRKAVGFPAVSSLALILLAAAVWGLAAWSDLERVERYSRAERVARMPAAEGVPSERILR